ncbi:MAG TPA: STM4014 family protein [Chloroflexia bacterium]|nr:STM4014 family protein [Chloroflexia bacterium]
MPFTPAQFVIIGNPGNRRVDLFQQALTALCHPPALLVPYQELLAGQTHLSEVIQPGWIVRIESPERDFELEKALLASAAEIEDEEDPGGRLYARYSRKAANSLAFDKGEILYPRQWFLGYRALLGKINQQLAGSPRHYQMNQPEDIVTMFDKPRCHALFQASPKIAVPGSLGEIHSYEALLARMAELGCYRVFVKLAHGSSASGVVAYQTNGHYHQATTTVEMVPGRNKELKLYNSRRLRTYRDQREIAALINALCRHRVQVERWVPKAGLQNRTFDLRVVVIGGEVRHVVVRLSRTSLTNLHLSSDRAGLEALLPRLKPGVWADARQSCVEVMGMFPTSFYAGIDLMITSDYRQHAVAEINAFGDLLYGTLHRGQDTYTAEISTFVNRTGEKQAGGHPVETEKGEVRV